jgi:hypothetical protein
LQQFLFILGLRGFNTDRRIIEHYPDVRVGYLTSSDEPHLILVEISEGLPGLLRECDRNVERATAATLAPLKLPDFQPKGALAKV